jgi:hypothetical protein
MRDVPPGAIMMRVDPRKPKVSGWEKRKKTLGKNLEMWINAKKDVVINFLSFSSELLGLLYKLLIITVLLLIFNSTVTHS